MNATRLCDHAKDIIDRNFEEYADIKANLAGFEEMIKSGDHSQSYIDEYLKPKRDGLKSKLKAIKESINAEFDKLMQEDIEELKEADEIKASELTDDAKLLEGNLILTERDVRGILKRSEGNRSMTQLALRYAEKNGMKFDDIVYHSAQDYIAGIKDFRQMLDYMLRYFDSDAHSYEVMYNTVFPAGEEEE